MMAYNVFSSGWFTALNDGKTSAILSFCRTIVFMVVPVLLLPNILGIDGTWLFWWRRGEKTAEQSFVLVDPKPDGFRYPTAHLLAKSVLPARFLYAAQPSQGSTPLHKKAKRR